MCHSYSDLNFGVTFWNTVYIILSLFSPIVVLVHQISKPSRAHLPLPLLRSTTTLSFTHHPASGISFPRNFACLQITKTYHNHLISVSHMSIRHFLHHHCHHPLLLLISTPDSKLIFSTNLFLRSSSTFPPTGLTPWTPGVFVFLGHVGFNFGIVC